MKVHSQMFPGGQHVVVFRERKSDSNVLAAKTTMEEKPSANCPTSSLPQTMNYFVCFVNLIFSGLRDFQRKDAM